MDRKDLFRAGLDGQHDGCDEAKNKHICGLGDSIELFISQDSANKLDSREQLVNGEEIDVVFGEETLEILKRSQWKRLRKRLGKKLSSTGEASVQVDIIDGKPFISLGRIISYRKISGILQEITLDAKEIVEIEGYDGSYPVYERFSLTEDGVVKCFGIETKDGWLNVREEITYPANITRIPVKIFQNNEDALSDINNTNMWWAINQLNEYSNSIKDTYLKTQFGLLVNRNMTGGKTASDLLKSLKEKGYIEVNGVDSQLGAGVSPIGAPGYVSELLLMIDWLEDKIMKYTFTTRDTTSSGSNKHNAEIGMFNQFAIEYLLDKKEIREEDYADFYNILSMFTGDIEVKTVELKISQVLENMLDAMNPETPQVQENINKDETSEEEVKEV